MKTKNLPKSNEVFEHFLAIRSILDLHYSQSDQITEMIYEESCEAAACRAYDSDNLKCRSFEFRFNQYIYLCDSH